MGLNWIRSRQIQQEHSQVAPSSWFYMPMSASKQLLSGAGIWEDESWRRSGGPEQSINYQSIAYWQVVNVKVRNRLTLIAILAGLFSD
jgi:hypothetical protein